MMLPLLLLALQAAQQAQPAQAAPDLQLDIHASIRQVKIEQRGTTSLHLYASPDGGTHVDVDKPDAAGRRRLRNVDVRVQAEARIADPSVNPPQPETPSPQRR